ncbi:cell wall-associated NlpC family hydrolase [Streptomyces sp. 1114.5]|uniref:C40 family peptidase n=1 Tax=unclassified Streptomyces TaxID=2593676 RepID=UPI000BD907D8|nr:MULTISPECIES: C40 family peptidase [unclassified Streptomyces]RKT19979.1 cell wall-associated NlpC family hydrolase [Streptomyces sp. 1114.5]SOB86172.1 Cell wall-associated hydrolase, NlpC family [Streptomyces sp. 1331.2]
MEARPTARDHDHGHGQEQDRCQDLGVGRRRMLGLALGAGLVPALAPAAHATPAATPARTASPTDALGLRVAAVAEAQLGVPYAWGGGDRLGASLGFCDEENGYLNGVCLGEKTVGFDCSGLSLYCWYRASQGTVELGHYTVAQFNRSAPVARDALAPGDLLFFSRPDAPLHHVGIHVGDGAMIHAERTGTLVARVENVLEIPRWAGEFAGARRPGQPIS